MNTALGNKTKSTVPIQVNLNSIDVKNFGLSCSGITEDNNYIYYCSEEGIKKVDKKNGKTKIICKQRNACELTVYGRYLFFLTQYGESLSIFRVSTSGENFAEVFNGKEISNVDSINSFSVIDNKLYIKFNNYSVYSYDMSTGEIKLLIEDAYKFQVVKEYIYYIEKVQKTFTIYKKNLYDLKTQIVLGKGISQPKSDFYDDFVFVSDSMYYTTHAPNSLYCYNDGKSIVITNNNEDSISTLIEYKGNAYYVIEADEGKNKLMKLNSKSNSISEVAELNGYTASYQLRIVNGYVYYSTEHSEIKNVRITE